MSERQPYSQFNLPSHHLPLNGSDAQPASARKPAEIYYRRSRRKGSLVLDEQRKGLMIADRMVQAIETGKFDDDDFTARMLAMAGINTSFYTYARDSRVMDRRLDLPTLASDEGDRLANYTSRSELLNQASGGMDKSLQLGTKLYEAFLIRREGVATSVRLGKSLGNTSLLLASLNLPKKVSGLTVFEAQHTTREHLLDLLEDARTIASKPVSGLKPMGSHPSIMQLADPNSDLSVYWRRNAPNDAVDLLESSIESIQ